MTYRYFSEKHLKNRVRATFTIVQDDSTGGCQQNEAHMCLIFYIID